MPRRRRCSSSPSDLMLAEDDDEFLSQEDFSPQGSDRCPPQQRNAANARERARMRVLSKAFCRLKTTLPWVPADTKLSKLDTLRLASGYIAHLRALLDDQPHEEQQGGRPLNLSWPFTFQHGVSVPWMNPSASPGRISPAMASRIPSSADNQSNHLQNSHHYHHSYNVNINNNNNQISSSDNSMNCEMGFHHHQGGYGSRSNLYYPHHQENGMNGGNNMFYEQIHSYPRHSFSHESLLHTG